LTVALFTNVFAQRKSLLCLSAMPVLLVKGSFNLIVLIFSKFLDVVFIKVSCCAIVLFLITMQNYIVNLYLANFSSTFFQ